MSIQDEIKKMEPWFHNIHLPDGSQTSSRHFLGDFPNFKWEKIKNAIPEDLSGWKVLDIGCNAGFYTIELARRGAEVLAIDLDDHYLKQAQWVAKQFALEDRITFKRMQVYDLAHIDEQFDLVWFMGVFYHLRYPMLAMDIIAQKVKKMMIFQTLALPGTEEMEIPPDVEFPRQGSDEKPGMAINGFYRTEPCGRPYQLVGAQPYGNNFHAAQLWIACNRYAGR
jgi:tRNA (mo5U34)-methyltransferase